MGNPIFPSDPEDLRRCFTIHSKELFGYACFMTQGDEALANDLVGECFRRGLKTWASHCTEDKDQIRKWLRETLHDVAVNVLRRNEMVRRKQAQVDVRYYPAEIDEQRDVLSKIALERSWQVVKRMSRRQHIIAEMRWREKKESSEIAVALGIDADTVSVELDDARKQLLAELGPFDPSSTGDTDEGMRHDGRGGGVSR